MKSFCGTIIRAVASRYYVESEGVVRVCAVKKALKSDIYVGDKVTALEQSRGASLISAVSPRKSLLIRPYVANIDAALIVIAPLPEPDLLLVDKLIVNCHYCGVKPILVCNKSDLSAVDISCYESIVDVVRCSAQTGEGIEKIRSLCMGKTVCLAGQSAVGKSSLINALFDSNVVKTGELAKRIARGKNTTRQSEIFDMGDFKVVDTCGFSMLEPVEMPPEQLRLYYDDYMEYTDGCKFSACTHTDEPDCAVKRALSQRKLNEQRYNRYLTLYAELKEIRRTKYE